MPELYCVSNTHFDPVWLWTWDEAMADIRATFRSALDRMDETPDYIYSFCCPAVFRWLEETDPRLLGEIKKRVDEGRWELTEGWWLQADCNTPMGESFIRQALCGQAYILEHFGQRSQVAFNVDSFGHNAMLPQIFRGTGIKYTVFWRPERQKLPNNLFRWQSPDGSEVLAYRVTDIFPPNVETLEKNIAAVTAEGERENADRLLLYGITNHGGAPTKAMLTYLSSKMAEGAPMRYSSVHGFFRAQEEKDLPAAQVELQTDDFGVFSNCNSVKSGNRRAEYALLNAERASVMAARFGKKYPLEKLRGAWQDLLFGQFHDILGGACILQANVDTRNLGGRVLQTASEITNYALQSVTSRISAGDGIWNIVVFNLNAVPYDGVVECEMQWVHEHGFYSGWLEITDEIGEVCPIQLIKELSVIPGFRSRIAFRAQVPSFGYRTFAVRRTGGANTRRHGGELTKAETARFAFDLSGGDGTIAVTDKKSGSLYALTPVARQDDGDVWAFNIDSFGAECTPWVRESSLCTESGELFTTMKTVSRFGDSILEQYVTLYEGRDYFDVRGRVSWNEKHRVLKLKLRSPAAGDTLRAGSAFCGVTRSFDGREYPMSQWLELGGSGDKLTVASRNLFAYDTDRGDSTVGLTVLRSPICGDLRLGELSEEDHEYLDQGITEWSLRVWPGSGYDGDTVDAYLNPPLTVCEAKHGGDLPPAASFLSVTGSGVGVSAIKQSEDGSGDTVLRLYERTGAETAAVISSDSGHITVPLEPWKIRTLRWQNDRLSEAAPCDMLEGNDYL